MKLFKNYVEVEQILTRKDSSIILPETAKESDKFDISQKVTSLGPECKNLKEGNVPIMSPHTQEFGRQWVRGTKEDKEMVFNVIYNEDDIIGIE